MPIPQYFQIKLPIALVSSFLGTRVISTAIGQLIGFLSGSPSLPALLDDRPSLPNAPIRSPLFNRLAVKKFGRLYLDDIGEADSDAPQN